MKTFDFSIPTKLVYGKDKHKLIGEYLKDSAQHVLIHYGSSRIENNGLLEAVTQSLDAYHISYCFLGGVQANPSVDLCQTGIKICQSEKVDTILAIGGGSVIDSAKAISIGRYSDEMLWKVLNTPELIPQKAMNIAAIVTLPATGSEANDVAVISNDTLQQKIAFSNPLLVPKLAILNPELTYTLSRYQTAIAMVDIFSHCFERYFDLTRESLLWDALCEATMKTVVDLGNTFINHPKSNDFRDDMMWSATVAHSNMLGPGGDFACHQLAHALTVQYGIPHGGALALIMPAWCQYVYQRHHDRFKCFFKAVFKVNGVEEGIETMKAFFEALGAPTTFDRYHIAEIDINELVDKVYSKQVEYVGNGLEAIYPEDAVKIYELIL